MTQDSQIPETDADVLCQVLVITFPDGAKVAAKILPAEDAYLEVEALNAAHGCRRTMQLLRHMVSCVASCMLSM